MIRRYTFNPPLVTLPGDAFSVTGTQFVQSRNGNLVATIDLTTLASEIVNAPEVIGPLTLSYVYVNEITPNYTIPRTASRRTTVPDQAAGVQITLGTETPPATYSVTIGPNTYGPFQIADLFNRTNFDSDQLFGNIRLRRIIGNYGVLWSQEFTDAINKNGVRIQGGDYYNVTFEQNDDGSYTLGFGSAIGQAPNQTITVDPSTLADDTHDQSIVLSNIGSFLRIAGYSDLTTPAASGLYVGLTGVQAVATWTFRY